MAIYKCQACGYEYDEEREGTLWDELEEDWCCPICGINKPMFAQKEAEEDGTPSSTPATKETSMDSYLKEWSKSSDPNENHLSEIHQMAQSGESISEPMKTRMPIISWDDIIIKGAQLHKIPLNPGDEVSTQTTIGQNSKHPLILETPIYISHMSFGAISKEFKTAMAKGSAAVKTCICSGEGGILDDELNNAYKYIFEYVPNEYSVTENYLKKVDAIEIKIGQSVKPGMGGHLPGDKVTTEIAQIRNKPVGEDIHSPSSFKDIKSKEDLKKKVDWLRDKSDGKPIGIKIAAGNIEKDLDEIIYANPDFVTIDGRGGATGSAPKFVKDHTSVPTLFALYRAKKHLEHHKREDIAIVITGGLRVSPDFAKAIALGATAVAIATSAMIAGGCQQYRICNTGNCPIGIATQDPELRKRINIDLSAKRIENFLKVSTEELKTFARLTGNSDIHDLSINDLSTGNSEISKHTDISHF
ncbi:glutamate synthase-related protein [Plebeiibacterium sediminum]|uniref:Glutamate synthase-related protein n=1 Tax=Plebeiibacterium sediminum TaxID=2992112 RepID=A0AAE3SEV9_9BACT|nr:glutamate synthase-related protein [Plebeiobacterium sediminum]MCW3786810.1 glutamate synthase-related protein [Plebeiobacterium sediminum]